MWAVRIIFELTTKMYLSKKNYNYIERNLWTKIRFLLYFFIMIMKIVKIKKLIDLVRSY